MIADETPIDMSWFDNCKNGSRIIGAIRANNYQTLGELRHSYFSGDFKMLPNIGDCSYRDLGHVLAYKCSTPELSNQIALNESDYMQWAAINDVCSLIENPLIDHVQFMQELTEAMTKSFIKRAMQQAEKENKDATNERSTD